MILSQWATRWGINPQAIDELRMAMGAVRTDSALLTGQSEAAIQTQVMLEASRLGYRLWRNNVGALPTENGGMVRYGLANSSSAMNRNVKSADLIGIRPVTIEPHHVGSVIGQFISREVKSGSWRWSGTPREKAQLRWCEIVTGLGGDACFTNSEGSL